MKAVNGASIAIGPSGGDGSDRNSRCGASAGSSGSDATPAANQHHLTRDVGGVGTDEVRNRGRDLGRLGHPLQREAGD